MPAKWNGKFMGVGNGGMGGSISYPLLLGALARGYATASTNTGHQGRINDGSYALGHREKVIDFGYRGSRNDGCCQATHRAVLRPTAEILVLEWVFDWRPAGADRGAAVSGGLRRDHCW